jgi:hypothetical protein
MNADSYRGLITALVAADVALIVAVVAAVLIVALGPVRRKRPDSVWPIVLAAGAISFMAIFDHVIAPAALRIFTTDLEANRGLVWVVPPLVHLVDDVFLAAAVGLLVLVIFRLVRNTAR